MKKYFLHDGSQQTGPFDIEELKAKNLTRDTPIWFEGLTEWTTIGNVEELKEVFITITPTYSTKISSPLPNQSSSSTATGTKRNSSVGRRLLIFGIVIVLVLVGFYVYNQIQHQQYQNERQEKINA